MKPEDINEMNENPHQKRVMEFLDLMTEKGYEVSQANFANNFATTELIANGSTAPIDKLNSLPGLEEAITKGETFALNFREDMRSALDTLASTVNANVRTSSHGTETFEADGTEFNKRIRDLKEKLGIVQDLDRVAQAEAAREATKKKIAALGKDNSLSNEQRMEEYRRLLFVYNGPNKAAVDNAKALSERAQSSVENLYAMHYVNEIASGIKSLNNETQKLNLHDDIRKQLVDQFRSITNIVNDYRTEVVKLTNAKKTLKAVLIDLGLEKSGSKKKTVEVAKGVEEPKQEEVIDKVVEAPEPVVEVVPEVEPTPEPVTVEDLIIDEPEQDEELEWDLPPVIIEPDEVEELAPEVPVSATSILDELEADGPIISEPAFDLGAIVVYNGTTRTAIPGFGSPKDLEVDQEYTITDLHIEGGVTYYRLEGLDELYDACLFDSKDISMNIEFEEQEINPFLNIPDQEPMMNEPIIEEPIIEEITPEVTTQEPAKEKTSLKDKAKLLGGEFKEKFQAEEIDRRRRKVTNILAAPQKLLDKISKGKPKKAFGVATIASLFVLGFASPALPLQVACAIVILMDRQIQKNRNKKLVKLVEELMDEPAKIEEIVLNAPPSDDGAEKLVDAVEGLSDTLEEIRENVDQFMIEVEEEGKGMGR